MEYYKAVRHDRRSHYDGTTLWRAGSVVRVDNPDPPEIGPCGHGIHCSPNILDAVSYQQGPSRYCLVEPLGIIASDDTKARCSAVRVLRWLKPAGVDAAAGFKLWEANHPVHPLQIKPRRVSEQWLRDRVGEWASVRASFWDSVRASVRDSVWASVRDSVWDSVWASVRASVWDSVWASVRDSVWASVRDSFWDSFWDSVGASVRASVRDSVWAYIGGLFPDITKWKYEKNLGLDPWRPLLRLWYAGYVPSFDGKTWRVHCGPDARVVLTI